MDRLEQIHAALAAALIRARGEEAFEGPVTVAEIYQDLVPYRAVRTELGFDMNADYEHTLLRLLAGEADLARLDPPEAREELQEELGAANPNVGLFRKFAGCDVWITRPRHPVPVVDAPEPARAASARMESDAWETRAALWMDPSSIPDTDPADPEAVEGAPSPDADDGDGFELLLEDAVEVDEPAASAAPAGPAETGPDEPVAGGTPPAATEPVKAEEPGLATTATPARGATGADPAGTPCSFCDSALPAGRTVRFCPFCGADQSLVPCGSCGEALDPAWRFCIACGASTPKSANQAGADPTNLRA